MIVTVFMMKLSDKHFALIATMKLKMTILSALGNENYAFMLDWMEKVISAKSESYYLFPSSPDNSLTITRLIKVGDDSYSLDMNYGQIILTTLDTNELQELISELKTLQEKVKGEKVYFPIISDEFLSENGVGQ